MLRTRSAVMRSIRETLHGEGFLEVETPVLQTIHGGAAARPFRTHLNAFDIDMTLRIALELFLKRAMVGGADRVYEIGRIFRNEGIDSSHSAEFTMLESYAAWGDQFTIAATTQKLTSTRPMPPWARGSSPAVTATSTRRRVDLAVLLPGLSAALGEQITVETRSSGPEIADAHEIAYKPDIKGGSSRWAVRFVEHPRTADVRLRSLRGAAWPARTATTPGWSRLGPHHRRRRGPRASPAHRPGHPANGSRRSRWRPPRAMSRPYRRGLPHRLEPAPCRWVVWAWARPSADAVHGHRDPGDDPVPVAPPPVLTRFAPG